MDNVFQTLLDHNFSDLKGMTADVSVPVPEYLINEIIQVTLQGNKSIDSCQAAIHEQNHISLNLKITPLPWAIKLKLKLNPSVDFGSYGSPKIRAWLQNNRLLGTLGSFLNALPNGVRLYGNQVVIDIGTFLETPEQRRLLELVKSIDIRTEEGKAVFDIKIAVD